MHENTRSCSGSANNAKFSVKVDKDTEIIILTKTHKVNS